MWRSIEEKGFWDCTRFDFKIKDETTSKDSQWNMVCCENPELKFSFSMETSTSGWIYIENRNISFACNFSWRFLQYKMKFSILDMEFLIVRVMLKQALSILVLLRSMTTKKMQQDPQDPSLLERYFIINLYIIILFQIRFPLNSISLINNQFISLLNLRPRLCKNRNSLLLMSLFNFRRELDVVFENNFLSWLKLNGNFEQ